MPDSKQGFMHSTLKRSFNVEGIIGMGRRTSGCKKDRFKFLFIANNFRFNFRRVSFCFRTIFT